MGGKLGGRRGDRDDMEEFGRPEDDDDADGEEDLADNTVGRIGNSNSAAF